jgi:transcriptional regulator with XRE-family HTH domain
MPQGSFGNLLKRKRQELSLSRRALADRLGITAVHVYWLESGHRRPSLGLLQRVADNLDLDGLELLILCYPAEFKIPGTSLHGQGPGKPDTVWKRFAANEGLRAKERVTLAELKVLKEVSRLGRVSSERQLLFVLRSIRLAFEDDWML